VDPHTSSFLYLSSVGKLADIRKPGINLDAVERIVIKRKTNDQRNPIQIRNEGPTFMEDTHCHGCGEKVQTQDLVVLDSLFYLWHNHCYQETEHPIKGMGAYNEVASRYSIFIRNRDDNQWNTDGTLANNITIELDSEKAVQPL
jgi:hypothetical protein